MPSSVPSPLRRFAFRRVVGVLGLAASIGVILSGCASSSVPTTPVAQYTGEPKGVEAPADSAGGAPWATWLDGGKRFAITLYGTAACPGKTSGYTVNAPDDVTLHVVKNCPAEFQPYTSVYETPKTLDSKVTIRFAAQGIYFYLAPLGGSGSGS